ncbi:MAG: tetratricopeptide repeat protein [Kiritimatiellaeota bacterium]|nr:tetratricopeptide repeat protein [Kiritimatiellota bacterium]
MKNKLNAHRITWNLPIALVVAIFLFSGCGKKPSETPATQPVAMTSLSEKIQKELDANPFLKDLGLKILVQKEENGYVTLGVVKGNKKIRKAIYDGIDIQNVTGIEIGFADCGKEEREAIAALKRVIGMVGKFPNVKEVALKAAINTNEDQAAALISLGTKYDNEKQYELAFASFEAAAKLGDAEAQNQIGYYYSRGLGVERDDVKCAEWSGKSAEQGNAIGQFNLGLSYGNGRGVEKNGAKAAKLFQQAAEQGMSKAQIALGELYLEGKVVPKNISKGIELLEKAAKADEAGALNALAWFYSTDKKPQYRDSKKALEYALKAQQLDFRTWYVNGTLAAAHAANNQFDAAVLTQERTISLLKDWQGIPQQVKESEINKAEKRLQLYKDHKPFIDDEE